MLIIARKNVLVTIIASERVFESAVVYLYLSPKIMREHLQPIQTPNEKGILVFCAVMPNTKSVAEFSNMVFTAA